MWMCDNLLNYVKRRLEKQDHAFKYNEKDEALSGAS